MVPSDEDLLNLLNHMRKLETEDVSEDDTEKYGVRYKGKLITMINKSLIESQGVSDENLEQIKECVIDRVKIFELMEATDNIVELLKHASDVEYIEYQQQRLWGFPEDYTFHRWFDVPKCTCPTCDNAERVGTVERNISTRCPIHFSPTVWNMCVEVENGR